jgi:hypothetical protein
MAKLTLSCILYLIGFLACAQDDGYYKELGKRSKSFEVENLPNLNSKFSSFYVGISGGFRKPFDEVIANVENFAISTNSMGELVELNVGINFNNRYFWETGLRVLKNNLSTYVFESPHNPGFTVGHTNKQIYLPMIVKRRILSLNRVTKNAQMNIGAGGGVLLNTRPSSPSILFADLQTSLRSPDLQNFFVTLSRSESPIFGEINLEIKGNITEKLEILVFGKGMFRKSHYLGNSFQVQFNGGQVAQSYSIFEKSGSLIFGLQFRLNSKKFYRYSSII